MLDKIKQIEEKYIELGLKLSDPNTVNDYEKFKELSKQRKAMEETVNTYNAYKEDGVLQVLKQLLEEVRHEKEK